MRTASSSPVRAPVERSVDVLLVYSDVGDQDAASTTKTGRERLLARSIFMAAAALLPFAQHVARGPISAFFHHASSPGVELGHLVLIA